MSIISLFSTLRLHSYKNCRETKTIEGTWCCSWLTHCGTAWKVAVSITAVVIEMFHRHKPSTRTVDLGSSQNLNRKEYQEYFLGIKQART